MKSGLVLRIGLILLVCVTGNAPAAAKTRADVEIARRAERLLEETARPTGPGAAVLIARGDQILFRAARGRADIELDVPLATDQVFRIASVTKIFTAALVMKLVQEGKLSLDDPLARFLPEFPEGNRITVRMLLNHTAGISDQPVNPQPGGGRLDRSITVLVEEIAMRPLSFAPGTDQAYSNAGYILLGAIVEHVTGQPWHAALEQRLLSPLGLAHTRLDATSTVIPHRVAGYSTNAATGIVENAPFVSMTNIGPAGALVSTLDDLAVWMRALAGGRGVGPEGYQQMVAPAAMSGDTRQYSYGFGLYTWRVRGETMIGHTGQINGFASILAYLPAQDITIVALANDYRFDAQTFGRRIAAIAVGQPYPAVVPVQPSTAVLRELTGSYGASETDRCMLLVREGRLYAQRPGRNAVPLQMTAEGRLHFVPDELSYFIPIRDPAGSVVRLDYYERGDGPPRALLRVPAT